MSHDGELGDVEFHKQNINPLLTREEDGLHHSNMRSRRPQHSQNIAEIWPPIVGHPRTIGGVKEEFVRVDNYGTFEYDGLTFGEEIVYIDTRNDKVIIHDKGWGMDPFDQLAPDTLWVDGKYPGFNARVFARHFFEHLFLPFSIPVMYFRHGPAYLEIQGFDFFKNYEYGFNFWHNYAAPVVFWLIFIIHFLNLDSFCKNNIVVMESISAMIAVALHRSAISLKYATLSDVEYKRFFSSSDPERVTEWIKEIQMVTGFFMMREKLCDWELGAAIKRAGLRNDDVDTDFAVSNPSDANLDQWRIFLAMDISAYDETKKHRHAKFPSQEELKKGTTFMIPVSAVARSLVGHARESAQFPFFQLCGFIGLLYAVIPIAMRASCKGDNIICLDGQMSLDVAHLHTCGDLKREVGYFGAVMGSTYLQMTYIFLAALLRFEFAFINFLFLSMSIVDNYRSYLMYAKLSDLLRPAFEMEPESPQLTWSSVNLEAWLRCRIIISEFGKRTQKRIEALYKLNTAGTLILVLIVVGRFLQDPVSEGLKLLKFLQILWYAFLMVTVWTIVTLSRLLFCAKINDEMTRQQTFLARLLNLSKALDDGDSSKFVLCVKNAIVYLEASAATESYSVFGIQGTTANAYHLLTFYLTGISIVVALVYGVSLSGILGDDTADD